MFSRPTRKISKGSTVAWFCVIIGMGAAVCYLGGTLLLGDAEVHAQSKPYPDLGPYDVIVFKHAQYVGEFAEYTLEPGRCQKLVPGLPGVLNDKVSSVLVGSKVGVTLFEHKRFAGWRCHWDESCVNIGSTSASECTRLNDKTSSLIVYLKENKGPIGLYLASWDTENRHYYPVNESCAGTTGYHELSYNDDSTKAGFQRETPSSRAIQFTLYQHKDYKGDWITLPGARDFGILEYDLGAYQFKNKASSLTLTMRHQVATRPKEPPATGSSSTGGQQAAPKTVTDAGSSSSGPTTPVQPQQGASGQLSASSPPPAAQQRPAEQVDQRALQQKGPKPDRDCVTFNPDTTVVTQRAGDWVIIDNARPSVVFGSFPANRKGDAERALALIKRYRMNELCSVKPSLAYGLASGQAPSGSAEGEDCISFSPDALSVLNVQGRWKVAEGNRWIFDFGTNEAQAREALAIIKYHGFRYSCFVGRGGKVGFQYLRK